MNRWKRSKGIRTFLSGALLVGVFCCVLAEMYMDIGKDYKPRTGEEGAYVSQEGTSRILDGYIRLFEEYMQIGNLITEDGTVDYDKEILVSLTDDRSYTIKELLRGSEFEGKAAGKLQDFMQDFLKNCENGFSYPWVSRFMLAGDTRVIVEGNSVFSFVSPNAKTPSEKQIKDIKRRLPNMQVTSTDDDTYADDFADSVYLQFNGDLSWEHLYHASSVYEEYLITYYPRYTECYFLDKVISSYDQPGNTMFSSCYQEYRKQADGAPLSQERFYRQLQKEYNSRQELLPEREIPWRVHYIPRTMKEARKYVTFLVETYQEIKYLLLRCNFVYGYENSSNNVVTNDRDIWERIKAAVNGAESMEKATDQSDIAFAYFNSRENEGVGNLPEETLPMSGNIIEKIKNIGSSYSSASYQIAVGINIQAVMSGQQDDDFVHVHHEMVEKGKLYRLGNTLIVVGGVMAALAFLLLCIRSGTSVDDGEEQEMLYWFDKIWLEAQLLLGYLLISMTLWVLNMWNGIYIQPVILTCAVAETVLLYCFLRIILSIIKRRKLRCGRQYSILYLFFSEVIWKKTSLRSFIKTVSHQMAFIPTKRKYGVLLLAETVLALYYGVSALYVYFDSEVTVRSYILSLFGTVGLLLGAVFLVFMFLCQRNAMHDQAAELEIISAMHQIIGGDFSYQLPEKGSMSLRVKELVRAVNQIGDVVENAVEESIRSERMKTELIANVSHDIKTPLTSIINYVDLLQGEEIYSETVQKYLHILEQKSQRLKVLMEDLIEASKASSGVMELDIQELDFCELVRQTDGEFEERFAQSQLELVADIPREPLLFRGDGRRVFRVLENLYSNSAKYAMEGTRVYVSLERREEKLMFTIKNVSAIKLNITPEELTERFVRGDHARTTEGSGLGLSIAKNLTELMEGEFCIELDGDLFSAKIIFPEMTGE